VATCSPHGHVNAWIGANSTFLKFSGRGRGPIDLSKQHGFDTVREAVTFQSCVQGLADTKSDAQPRGLTPGPRWCSTTERRSNTRTNAVHYANTRSEYPKIWRGAWAQEMYRRLQREAALASAHTRDKKRHR